MAWGQTVDSSGTGATVETPKQLIATAVRTILLAIGEDPEREGLRETPRRAASAWQELTNGYHLDPSAYLERTFPPDGADDELVLVRDIPFYSLCEHHLIPFFGQAHVAYIPKGQIVGLSKIARCVRGYAGRLQVQERLTNQIADAMDEKLEPLGTAVVLQAEHLCMGMRGVKADGSLTVTSALRGVFRKLPEARAEVLKLLEVRR